MLTCELGLANDRPLTVLCLGAHSDDIEIGCGGTILYLVQHKKCTFHWIVFCAEGERAGEAQLSAGLFTRGASFDGPMVKTFRDGFMPFAGAGVKEIFETIKETISPDLILTHSRLDMHQDHRLVGELTWNTFRDHLILEYEIPKYDGDLGQPSIFVPLTLEECERKVNYIMKAFESQQSKRWFKPETFFSLMRLRGVECNSPTGYAEAFYCRKLVMRS
jgi:LmbE family N-acetylglucosaminyl deacetylase